MAAGDRKAPALSVVPSVTVAQRVQALLTEAKTLAGGHVADLRSEMLKVSLMAAEIAEGGDAYPPGVRDVARVLAEDLAARAQTIEAISSRS